jgi:hypothetical protein
MLIVGGLNQDQTRLVDSVLPKKLRADKKARWRSSPPKIAVIDTLNVASAAFFTKHVAKLERIPSGQGCEKSRFPHLPWWLFSILLPLEFPLPADLPTDSSGWPVFVGSSITLLKELETVRTLSKARLGEIPAGYELMRSNPKKFYKTPFTAENDNAILQWVWRALFDAATLSREKNAPVWGAFD